MRLSLLTRLLSMLVCRISTIIWIWRTDRFYLRAPAIFCSRRTRTSRPYPIPAPLPAVLLPPRPYQHRLRILLLLHLWHNRPRDRVTVRRRLRTPAVLGCLGRLCHRSRQFLSRCPNRPPCRLRVCLGRCLPRSRPNRLWMPRRLRPLVHRPRLGPLDRLSMWSPLLRRNCLLICLVRLRCPLASVPGPRTTSPSPSSSFLA